MSKIPEWALAEARKIAISLNGFATPDDFQRIALALVEAERRGIEKAANLAKDFIWDDHALAQATGVGKACHFQSVEIEAAIRQLAEDGK